MIRRSSALNDRIDIGVGVAVLDGDAVLILSIIDDIFVDKVLIEWMKQDSCNTILSTKDPAPPLWRKLYASYAT